MHFLECTWLMPAHPFEFRRGKTRHDKITALGHKGWCTLLKVAALFKAAPVVPEDRRPNRSKRFIQKRRTVHLSGQADRLHPMTAVHVQLGDGHVRGGPPIRWILFGPEGFGTRNRKFRLADFNLAPCLINQRCLHAGCAYVDP